MKQVLQNVSSGELSLAEVPTPASDPGGARVRTTTSLISAGTEKMIIELSQKSLVGKARARPDLARQVIAKARKEGLKNTYETVRSRLERPLPLGYSAAGIVESVGASCPDLIVGDRVAMAGAGYANHAEINFVPRNLLAKIPDGVSDDEAAYTTVASIALQGVRMGRPELGDNVVVIGLGLIGLIAVQLLKANGCRVFGVDLDPAKVTRALEFGADAATSSTGTSLTNAVEDFTGGWGSDMVLIAAATKSSEPIRVAGEIARRKAQIIVVGAVGMDVPRDLYYKKELELKVSMSYGPGRYDPSYEEEGIDYPYEYVRWTENRNMQAVLSLMADGKLSVSALTTHRFDFADALAAYELIANGSEPYVGVVLEYETSQIHANKVVLDSSPAARPSVKQLGVGFIGAGNYASLQLLPHVVSDDKAILKGLATFTGLSAKERGDKFGFEYCTTNPDEVLSDTSIDVVFVATRHSTHADFVVRCLAANKHVFVEKPLVVSEAQLDEVKKAYLEAQQRRPTALMVGLNRRFSPLTEVVREHLDAGVPRQLLYRVNSGHIPTDSWVHQQEEGGGMLVGEMCHFLDLMMHLVDEQPARVFAQSLQLGRSDIADHDNVTIVVGFDGGSTATLCYNTVGDKAAPKERLEVYSAGVTAVLDDFRSVEVYVHGKRIRKKLWNQDKGQRRQIQATLESFRESGISPIPFSELESTMRVVFSAQESLRSGSPVDAGTS